MDLLAAQFPTGTVRSGDVLPLTLLWRSVTRLDADYTVTVRLWDTAGRMVLQTDQQPVDGFRPTSTWETGEIIRDNYALVLPADLASGYYRLTVGVYQWPSLQRLPLQAPAGLELPEPGLLLLGQVAVGVPAAPQLPYPVMR